MQKVEHEQKAEEMAWAYQALRTTDTKSRHAIILLLLVSAIDRRQTKSEQSLSQDRAVKSTGIEVRQVWF